MFFVFQCWDLGMVFLHVVFLLLVREGKGTDLRIHHMEKLLFMSVFCLDFHKLFLTASL